jgi:xanthine dehydrogenase accessory factor
MGVPAKMNRILMEKILEELDAGAAGVLCTVTEECGSTPRSLGACMWVRPDGTIMGTVGGGLFERHVIDEALRMLEEGQDVGRFREALNCAGVEEGGGACGGELGVFLEVLGRERELVVFGAGHVGRAIARTAAGAGFRVTVWDEREEYANPENVPWGRTIACPLEEIFDQGLMLHEHSFLVIVTRGHALDAHTVRFLEKYPSAYIGLIGSRKKIAVVRSHLIGQGVAPAYLDRIFQPVGLPIRAETPEEIAVSVVAELIAVHRGADLADLRRPLGKGSDPCYPRFD